MASKNSQNPTAGETSESDLEALESGKFADAHVQCDGRTWQVHRVIVCGRSKWFDKALGGNFKEASDKKVTIWEFPSAHVDWLLRYIYGGDALLSDTGSLDNDPFVALCVAHRLGDYFDMDKLCKAAIISVYKQCNSAINAHQTRVRKTEQHFQSKVGMSRELFYASFFAGVGMAYEMQHTAVTSLQEAFIEFVRRTRYIVLKCDAFSARMHNHHEFVRRLMHVISDELIHGTLPLREGFPLECKNCQQATAKTGSHYARVTGKAERSDGAVWREGICSICFQAGGDL